MQSSNYSGNLSDKNDIMGLICHFHTKKIVHIFLLCIMPFLLLNCRKKELPVDEMMYMGIVYFYTDLPEIRGYTSTRTGEPLCIYTVKIVLAYPADNRRVALEISRKKLAIIDKVRNQLERYPESAFLGDTVNSVKEPVMDAINQILVSGKILALLLEAVDVYPIPRVER